MSYCVNCGVELDESAKSCALCSTPVMNPNKPETEDVPAPFSSEEHIPKSVKARVVALIVTMVLVVPNIVCLLINALFFPSGFWSFYIGATSFLAWVIFVFPFLTKKPYPYIMWGFDTASVALYVYLFFAMGNDTVNWYFKAALPMILAVSLLVLIFMVWVRKKQRHWVLKTLHIFADIGISALICGSILSVELSVPYASAIGIIAFICFMSIVAFLGYCYSSKTLRKWFSKRLFT